MNVSTSLDLDLRILIIPVTVYLVVRDEPICTADSEVVLVAAERGRRSSHRDDPKSYSRRQGSDTTEIPFPLVNVDTCIPRIALIPLIIH